VTPPGVSYRLTVKSMLHTVQVTHRMNFHHGAVAAVSVLLSSSARPASFALGADVARLANVSRSADTARNVSFGAMVSR